MEYKDQEGRVISNGIMKDILKNYSWNDNSTKDEEDLGVSEFTGLAKREYQDTVPETLAQLQSDDINFVMQAFERQISFLSFKDNTEPSLTLIETNVFQTLMCCEQEYAKPSFYTIVNKMCKCGYRVVFPMLQCHLLDRINGSGDFYNKKYKVSVESVYEHILKASPICACILFSTGVIDSILENIGDDTSFYSSFALILNYFIRLAPRRMYRPPNTLCNEIDESDLAEFREMYAGDYFNEEIFNDCSQNGILYYNIETKEMSPIILALLKLLNIEKTNSFFNSAEILSLLVFDGIISPFCILENSNFNWIFDNVKPTNLNSNVLKKLMQLLSIIIYKVPKKLDALIGKSIFRFLMNIINDFSTDDDQCRQETVEYTLDSVTNILVENDYSSSYANLIRKNVFQKIAGCAFNGRFKIKQSAMCTLVCIFQSGKRYRVDYEIMEEIVNSLDPDDNDNKTIGNILNHLDDLFSKETMQAYDKSGYKTSRQMFLDVGGADMVLKLLDEEDLSQEADDFYNKYVNPNIEIDVPDEFDEEEGEHFEEEDNFYEEEFSEY